MSSLLNSPDILTALQQKKRATERKLKASRLQILESANQFWSPMPKATSRAQSISRLVSNGFLIYNGIRVFSQVVSSVRSLFGFRRRRR